MTYEQFTTELFSDTLWKEQVIDMVHKGKNIATACQKLYGQVIADGSIKFKDMGEHRKHLHNILCGMKVEWWNVPVKKEEPTVEIVKPVERGSERYLDYCQQVLNEIAKSKTVNMYPGKSYAELAEEGGVRRPKDKPYPMTTEAEEYVKKRHLEYIKQNYEPRTGEKLPTWIPENEWILQYENGMI